MTQLLISVKNVAEAHLALDAGVDIIDLKDPSVGALGALGVEETLRILQVVDGLAVVSATVGEQHAYLNDLVLAIEARAEMGIDIIKIAVSPLFYDENFVVEMAKLSIVGIKIVAVFFADVALDFGLLDVFKKAGFYGAMLDTQAKQRNLLQVQTLINLQTFTHKCDQYHLKSGFAGSLRLQHVTELLAFQPSYIGFRGGVCDSLLRSHTLELNKVIEVKNMLREHNKTYVKPHKTLGFALHS
jgi:(5-formylfuran-3-yl)methyl phosphate synthase